MKIYLASPFFKESETPIYDKVIKNLRERGHDVFVPREHIVPNGWEMSNPDWGKAVFALDLEGLNNAETVVVLDWGMYADCGTAWECGYAYAKGKNVIVVSCDNSCPHSVMMCNGSKNFITLENLLGGHWWSELDFAKGIEQK